MGRATWLDSADAGIPAIRRIEDTRDIGHLDVPVANSRVGFRRHPHRCAWTHGEVPGQPHRQPIVAGQINVHLFEGRLPVVQIDPLAEQRRLQRPHLFGRVQALVVLLVGLQGILRLQSTRHHQNQCGTCTLPLPYADSFHDSSLQCHDGFAAAVSNETEPDLARGIDRCFSDSRNLMQVGQKARERLLCHVYTCMMFPAPFLRRPLMFPANPVSFTRPCLCLASHICYPACSFLSGMGKRNESAEER